LIAPGDAQPEAVMLEALRRACRERDAAIAERDAQAEAFAAAQAELRRQSTERERAFRELARQRAVLQQIIDTIPYTIFWKDRQSVYLGANRKKLEVLGFTALEQIVGKTDFDTGVGRENAEQYRRGDREVMAGCKNILDQEEMQLRGDGPHVLLTSKVPLRDEEGTITGVLGSYIDITDRKRMETELAHAKEAAEAAARTRSDLLTTISHELRTPLTLVLGPLEELLGRDSEGLSAPARVHLERIRRNACRLYALVNDILDLTKLEAGCMGVRRQPVDVAALVAELVEDARSVAEQKRLALSFEAEPQAGRAELDRGHLETIVTNLLGNALKYTPSGGRIDVRLRALGEDLELSVGDTGPGIPPEKHRIIFERFQQLDGPATRRYPGTGLGLALVKELTGALGGCVRVESAVGKGSLFVVVLPRAGREPVRLGPVEADAEGSCLRNGATQFERLSALFEEAQAPRSAELQAGAEDRPEVLIADDDGEVRAYMTHLLEDRYAVTAVADGVEALEQVRRRAPAVIVADIMMPNLDGLGLVARLKSDPKLRRIPIIIVTARAGREAVTSGLESGADDYLSKPFGPSELRARVRAAERQGALLDELVEKHDRLEQTLLELRATQDQLVQVGKMAAVGTLAAGVSHELNNPLATVLMAAQGLLRRLPPDSPLRGLAEAIERQAVRSGRLVTLLLDFSHRRPGEGESFGVEDLVCRVVELARSHARGGNAVLKVERPPAPLPPVRASVEQIEVALLNVVKNALDATEGGGNVRILLHPKRRDGAEGVEIAVHDSGCGIAPEILPQIFDPFFTTKPVGSGTGLGLSLTHRIVESHGGQIRVDSRPGGGTTVALWLRAAVAT
jgi:PAS domain S-box-containing protein